MDLKLNTGGLYFLFPNSSPPYWCSGWYKPALLAFDTCNIDKGEHFCGGRHPGAAGNCVLGNGVGFFFFKYD